MLNNDLHVPNGSSMSHFFVFDSPPDGCSANKAGPSSHAPFTMRTISIDVPRIAMRLLTQTRSFLREYRSLVLVVRQEAEARNGLQSLLPLRLGGHDYDLGLRPRYWLHHRLCSLPHDDLLLDYDLLYNLRLPVRLCIRLRIDGLHIRGRLLSVRVRRLGVEHCASHTGNSVRPSGC